MRKFKKPLIIFFSAILIFVVVVIVFISPIAKYLVEKYDEEYTGRQIKIDWAYVNPFTGYVHLSNVRIYEYKSDSIFFSSSGISTSIALRKLFSKTYEITELTLNRPRAVIIQNKTDFNFNDLIDRFASKDTTVIDTIPKEPLHFNVLNVRIKNGEFHYIEKLTPINYFIKEVNIYTEGKRWDSDSMSVAFSFLSGIGSGEVKGNFALNVESLQYQVSAMIHKFDLQIIGQYIKDLTNYGTFRAFLDADIKSHGNFNDQSDVTFNGKVAVTDLHFGKNPKEDYLSFERLMLAIEDISPKKHIYTCDSIALNRPWFKYERYDYLDNLQNMFGREGSNIQEATSDSAHFNLVVEIARYVKVLAKNFFDSPYKIGKLDITNGDIIFNDYSTSEKFSAELKPMSIHADSIDKNHKGGKIYFKSGIKPYGDAGITITVNPENNANDFEVATYLQKIPLSMFNPYVVSYTSYPLNRGSLEFKSSIRVNDGKVNSNNHLLVIDPKVTKRIKNKDMKWLPMPLIMIIIREYGNVIDYEIPITGDLKNPKFHFRDVIFDLLKNLLIKPVTTPYRMEVRNVEGEIEKMMTIKWPVHGSTLRPSQEKFIEKMVDFLHDNPDALITVSPQQYAAKEKEYILLFEAKKKYFVAFHKNHPFTEEDSITVSRMSAKDSLFVHYINRQIPDTLVFTMQERCMRFVDSSIVNKRFAELNKRRKEEFLLLFKARGVDNRVKFTNASNVVPYNGFSYFRIDYKGEFPEDLMKAYDRINELNDETPRKKFEKERRKYTKP